MNKFKKIEIKSIADFELLISKINKMSPNSNIIISLVLEKALLNNEFSRSQIISQLDFVELSSSEHGLPNDFVNINTTSSNSNYYSPKYESKTYKSVNDSFNSLYNHIISSAVNQNSKSQDTLTNALKGTLNPLSYITIITCIIPNERTNDSNNALKVNNLIYV